MRKINCKWGKESASKQTVLLLVVYTVLFLVITATIIGYLEIRNRSFLRMTDSIAQHFPALCYIRNYLRGIIKGVISGNGFSLPMIDFSIGQGFDIIGTLNYYGLGNPVNLVTLFFPAGTEETMYFVILFLHIYLAGLAFFWYCCQIKIKRNIYLVIGCLLYAYCSFTLHGGFKHPLFLTGVLYLPLLLIGVERILQKKRVLVLAIVVGLAFMSNYYFMYINTLLAAIYFFIRLYGQYKILQCKGVLKLVLKIIIAYLWGISLAGVVLFPAIYAFINNARGVATSTGIESLYYSAYYAGLLERFIFSNSVGKWTIPGIGILGFFTIIIFWIRRDKKNKQLFIGFLLFLGMLLFPVVGSLMNGFAYASNRWTYGFAFLLALIAIIELPHIKDLTKKQLLWLGGISILTIGIILKVHDSQLYHRQLLIFVVVGILILLHRFLYKVFPKRKGTFFITGIALFTIILNASFLFGEEYINWTKSFKEKGWTVKHMEDSAITALDAVNDETFYRVEQYGDSINYALYTGRHNPTSFYYSIIPGTMSELYQGVSLGTNDRLPVLMSLDSRSVLTTLAAVKYYVSKEDNSQPYAFKKHSEIVQGDGSISYLYENQNALPLGYTYDETMLRENYEELTALEKEQTLLDYAVVDNKVKDIPVFTKAKDYNIEEKPFTVKQEAMQSKLENKELSGKKGEQITMNFDGTADCENYLYIKGFQLDDKVQLKGKGDNDFNSIVKLVGRNIVSYTEKEGVLVNLGYSEKGMKEFTLTFQNRANVEFEDIKIFCVSMSDMTERVGERGEEKLEDIIVSTNQVSGKITTTEDKILQVSIPYSKGWKVYVDGGEVETFSSSVAYTGIFLEQGEHEVVLKYSSPWLVPGIICTISGLLAIGYEILQTRGKNLLGKLFNFR